MTTFLIYFQTIIFSLFCAFPLCADVVEQHIEQCSISQEIVFGEISTVRDARRHARQAKNEMFGWDARVFLSVHYNEELDIWLVYRPLFPHTLGATPGVVLQGSDGRVLAIWQRFC